MDEIMKETNEVVETMEEVAEGIVETVVTPELKESGIDAMFILKTGAIALVIGGVIYVIKNKNTIKTKLKEKQEKKTAKKIAKLVKELEKYGLTAMPKTIVEAATEVEGFEEDDLEK